jgi:protein phosphatase
MLIESGDLTDATARGHPRRNMVTQVLGVGEPQPQTRTFDLVVGDWLLLCSDGLNDELSDAQIAEGLIGAQADIEQAADLLMQRALAHGGRDNVSLIVIAPSVSVSTLPEKSFEAPPSTVEPLAEKKFPFLSRLALAAGVLLILIFLWGAA